MFVFLLLVSKKHWNSVYFNSDVSENQIKEMIVNSYDLVVKGLTKKDRTILENLK